MSQTGPRHRHSGSLPTCTSDHHSLPDLLGLARLKERVGDQAIQSPGFQLPRGLVKFSVLPRLSGAVISLEISGLFVGPDSRCFHLNSLHSDDQGLSPPSSLPPGTVLLSSFPLAQ